MEEYKLSVIFLGVVLVLLSFMVVFDHVYYMYHPKLDITCENNWSVTLPYTESKSALINNYIQGSHAYTEQISNRDTLTCIKADSLGGLTGSSMNPTFFEGNIVVMKNYNDNVTLHSGDMVRFFRYTADYPNCSMLKDALANNSMGGAWINVSMAVIHRINSIYEDKVVVQGDNLVEQEAIERCQITGVVVSIIFK
jgi:hypothetical protein